MFPEAEVNCSAVSSRHLNNLLFFGRQTADQSARKNSGQRGISNTGGPYPAASVRHRRQSSVERRTPQLGVARAAPPQLHDGLSQVPAVVATRRHWQAPIRWPYTTPILVVKGIIPSLRGAARHGVQRTDNSNEPPNT